MAGDRGVELSEVRFGYTDTEVLHGADLSVRPGERLAMVGPNGAGKSTLGKLVAGIHVPSSGRIRVDGTDLASSSPQQRRAHVILLSQESHLFRGTITENLTLAAEDAGEADLWNASEAVGAVDWVRSLSEGLRTPVGSGHATPDPARVQQLALARVVLADPAVLVLDEATSLMDPRSARHLERSPSVVSAGRTVLLIAIGCTRRTTPTGSRWSRAAWSASSAPTRSCCPVAAPTPTCGMPGTATEPTPGHAKPGGPVRDRPVVAGEVAYPTPVRWARSPYRPCHRSGRRPGPPPSPASRR